MRQRIFTINLAIHKNRLQRKDTIMLNAILREVQIYCTKQKDRLHSIIISFLCLPQMCSTHAVQIHNIIHYIAKKNRVYLPTGRCPDEECNWEKETERFLGLRLYDLCYQHCSSRHNDGLVSRTFRIVETRPKNRRL